MSRTASEPVLMTEKPQVTPTNSTSPPLRRRSRLAVWSVRGLRLLVLLVLLALPLYVDPPFLNAGQYVMIGAVGAIGLTLVTGQAGQLSLAHGFFLLAGATAYTVLTGERSGEGLIGFGLDPLVALLGAVAFTAALGLAFAPVAGRLSGIYLGIASLALVYLGLYLGQSLDFLTGGTSTGRPVENFSLFGFPFSNRGPDIALLGVPFGQEERLWYLFLALTLIAYLLATGAIKSRTGRSWRAVRDNETAAQVMGVSPMRAKAGTFAVSSAYAGLAGVMTALWFDILKPDESETGTYGINVSIAFLAMIIIGGLGSVPGAVVGAVLVFGLPQVLTLYSSKLGFLSTGGTGQLTPALFGLFVYGAAIVLVVMFEPGGLAAIGRRLTARLRR